jgi:hypothetical protein
MLWEFFIFIIFCALAFAYLTAGVDGCLVLVVLLLVLCATVSDVNSYVRALLPFLWYGFTYRVISLRWSEFIIVTYPYVDFPLLYGQVLVMWFVTLIVFYLIHRLIYGALYFLFLFERLFSQSEYFSELFSYYKIAGEDFC